DPHRVSGPMWRPCGALRGALASPAAARHSPRLRPEVGFTAPAALDNLRKPGAPVLMPSTARHQMRAPRGDFMGFEMLDAAGHALVMLLDPHRLLMLSCGVV